MVTVNATPLSAGPGAINYFLREQGCVARDRALNLDERYPTQREHDRTQAHPRQHGGRDAVDYYIGDPDRSGQDRGEPVGVWVGSGLGVFGKVEGDPIREDEARALFERAENPVSGEPLGARFRTYRNARTRLREALEREPNAGPERVEELRWQIHGSQRSAVAMWDLTFAAPKSVSVLYAVLSVAGREAGAETVRAAHQQGVAAGLAHLEATAGWSRRGYHGKGRDGRPVGEWVAADQWTGVRFDHTTSRTGDPHLHSHVLVPNRVRCADVDAKTGERKWRSLDGRGLYQVRRDADGVYKRVMFEALLRDLGASAHERGDGQGWEVAGISREVMEAFSSRRASITDTTRAYIADYMTRHGHAPDAYQLSRLAEAAWKETRAAKGPAETSAERRARWSAEPRLGDGSEHLARVDECAAWADPPVSFNRAAVIEGAVTEVQQRRASWTAEDLRAAINVRVPLAPQATQATTTALVDGLVAEALAAGGAMKVVGLTPPEVVATPAAALRDHDGLSRFARPMAQRYATEAQLSAEQRLVRASRAGGAPTLMSSQLRAVERSAEADGLNAGQRAALLGILGSGRQIDVLVGPAGTGKSFTVGALAKAWQDHHGRPVLGLATSQIATEVLVEDGLVAINTSRFLTSYERDPETGLPALELEAGTLLVVDETGMAATGSLDRVRAVAEERGAKLVFTGDHEQLDAVGAGGALRQLSGEVPTFVLDEVVRFRQDWEREASLGLREGRGDVLRVYDAHGRLFEGREQDMVAAAKDVYLASRLRGQSALLMVPTNEQAADLSGQLRAHLQALGVVSTDDQATARLADRNLAGVGDVIQCRRNDWRNRSTGGRAVINRDLWRVVEHRPDGSVRAEKLDDGGRAEPQVGEVVLSPTYLTEHCRLAYAVTNHAAQGVTVQAGYKIVDLRTTRSDLYTGMTRGYGTNVAFVITRAPADHDQRVEPLDTTRFRVLEHALEQDTAQRSATDTLRAELEHAESMAALLAPWRVIGDEQNRHRYADILATVLSPDAVHRLDGEHGVERLWRAVRSAELAGYDPVTLLPRLVGRAPLTDARSLSDVLRHRLHREAGECPTSQCSSWQARTPAGSDELGRFRVELARALDDREQALGCRAVREPPPWALDPAISGLGPVPEDPLIREQWAMRAGIVSGYREGFAADHLPDTVALGAAPSRENPDARAAWERAWAALAAPNTYSRDYAAATDAQLRELIAVYEREKSWAPEYVADLLRVTEQRHTRFDTRAALREAQLPTIPDPDERATLAGRAKADRARADHLADRAATLRKIHAVRQEWVRETAGASYAAEHATRELGHRHPAGAEHSADPSRAARPSQAPDVGERQREQPATALLPARTAGDDRPLLQGAPHEADRTRSSAAPRHEPERGSPARSARFRTSAEVARALERARAAERELQARRIAREQDQHRRVMREGAQHERRLRDTRVIVRGGEAAPRAANPYDRSSGAQDRER